MRPASRRLSSTLPNILTGLGLLANVRLNDNNFSGTIPNGTFSDLGLLARLSLADNSLTGAAQQH